MIVELNSSDNKLIIDTTLGGRATQFYISGLQILGPSGDHPLIGGWYLMAPWAGRISNNEIRYKNKNYKQDINFQNFAIHGTAAFSEGQITHQNDFSVEITHQTDKNWPVLATIKQKWKLTNNFLETSAQISCESGEFPAQLGWHPWFKRQLAKGKPARFGIEAISQYVKDENLFTLNETKPIAIPPFDDAFDVPSGKGFIEWPEALRLDFQGNVQTFVIYDEPADVFCIEPQTGPPDAINQNPVLVSPGKPLKASVKWEISRS